MCRAVERERCDSGDVRLPAWSGLQRVAGPRYHADRDGQKRGALYNGNVTGAAGLHRLPGDKTVSGWEDHAVAELPWLRRKYHGGRSQRPCVREAVEAQWGYF